MNTASRTSTSSSAKELQEAGARSDTNSDSLTDISFFVSLVEFLNFNINIQYYTIYSIPVENNSYIMHFTKIITLYLN